VVGVNAGDRRYEDLQREVAVLRRLLEATRAEVAELRSRPEPWLDYEQLAAHYSCGRRTMEQRKAEGMPMELLDGKQKGQLSRIDPWLVEHGYLPRPEPSRVAVGSTNGAAPSERPAPDTTIGGRDVQAA
jgi:hypothetical protein